MRRSMSRQRGATLIVVLIMLVILTLFAISAVNLSSSNLRVISNMQARKLVEQVGLQGSEQVMSSMANFTSPTAAVTFTGLPTGVTVTASKRVCQIATAASGYSAVQPIVPEDTQWDYYVTVTDSITNASARFWQGTKIRMLAGNCPNNLTY
jgi:Tfp pilus assembly protein PilX